MSNPVVHFEIIGREPAALRRFYEALFGWRGNINSPVAAEVSEPGNYGFIDASASGNAIAGGIGGGLNFAAHTLFYVGVEVVEDALEAAERLGAKRIFGPARNPSGELVVGQFTDPEGNLVGVAGPR